MVLKYKQSNLHFTRKLISHEVCKFNPAIVSKNL